ncbi:MAG: hypothetical protein PWR24_1886, partial [Desulfonauticus sp.]|nr:hypothetical protein [Desulfonauticus sp.]
MSSWVKFFTFFEHSIKGSHKLIAESD